MNGLTLSDIIEANAIIDRYKEEICLWYRSMPEEFQMVNWHLELEYCGTMTNWWGGDYILDIEPPEDLEGEVGTFKGMKVFFTKQKDEENERRKRI